MPLHVYCQNLHGAQQWCSSANFVLLKTHMGPRQQESCRAAPEKHEVRMPQGPVKRTMHGTHSPFPGPAADAPTNADRDAAGLCCKGTVLTYAIHQDPFCKAALSPARLSLSSLGQSVPGSGLGACFCSAP